jgi:Nucleotidyl transferase AbiEii toxin, Type IV TA system
MHLEILNESQQKLLPLLYKFKKEFYMVGGTAIALHIGHRLSIDFDLFKNGDIKAKAITKKFEEKEEAFILTLNIDGQLNMMCRDVKFTFFNFPYEIPHNIEVEKSISIPTLLDLAAMKAFALGRRSKWKDYLDLYFILKLHHNYAEISKRAEDLFGDMFSQKLFRAQLSYFKDVSYDEKVEFMLGFEVDDNTVKDFLTTISLQKF